MTQRSPAARRWRQPDTTGLVGTGRLALLGKGPSMADMTTVPDRARVRLPGISSRAYEHPADRSALVAMRKLTGFDVLLKRLAGLFSDRSLRLLFMASSVRASNEQFPDLYRLLLDGSAILDLPEVPELFISQDPMPTAMALGSAKPLIVATTTRLACFPVVYMGRRVIIAGLCGWFRKSELSCDRPGLLASQDPAAARRAL